MEFRLGAMRSGLAIGSFHHFATLWRPVPEKSQELLNLASAKDNIVRDEAAKETSIASRTKDLSRIASAKRTC